MGKIDEALDILIQIGIPKGQQNERSALTLLTLLNMKEDISWSEAEKNLLRIHDIMIYIKNNFGKEYAENTRETIRRQTLHQFEQGGLVIRNPDDPLRPTNSPNTVYQITDEAYKLILNYGYDKWNSVKDEFISIKGRLIDRYDKRILKNRITVQIEDTNLSFSPGKHNKLQVQIVTLLKDTFFPSAQLIYVGDTARKMLHIKEDIFKKMNIPISKHDKLPDVIFYNDKNNLLFLIEAVTSHGPITPKRQIELIQTLAESNLDNLIFISAFQNFKEFKRHISDIAWETEVWISSNPEHMIHFNGEKFLQVIKGG